MKKRNILIINAPFQIKFSLIVCSLIFLSSLIYPIVFIDYVDQIVVKHPEVATTITQDRISLILLIASVQLIFIAVVFVLFLWLTLRIAGPMYKLKKHLDDIRMGSEVTPLTFRSGDYFHDVAEEVTLFLDSVVQHQHSDFEYIDEVAQYVSNLIPVVPDDKKPIVSEIIHKLKTIRSRYERN